MLFRLFTIVAVLALAVSTWILSSPNHRPLVEAITQKADLPGYYLEDAVLTDFDSSGAPNIRLEARHIDEIDHSTEVALTQVRVRYEAPNGQNWVIVGDTGRVEPGGQVIDLAGNVVLTGDDTRYAGTPVVHTESLRYDVPTAVVTTPSDVRLDYGPQTLSARGLKANLKERTMHLESKVYGRFLP